MTQKKEAECEERGLVQVTRPRNWWRAAYTVCLSELTRAIRAGDGVDIEAVVGLLPVLSEAADDPELEALEAEMRLEGGVRSVTEKERRYAKHAVRWIGTPPAFAVGG